MPIETNIALFGVGLQKDVSTPAKNPVFVHGLTGGTPFHFDRTINAVQVACGTRAPSGAYVDSIETNPSIETLGYQEVAPLYCLGAMGKIESTKIDDGLYKHVVTLGDTIPYLTVWGQEGIGNFNTVQGCKVSELAVEFENGEPLKLSPELMGCHQEFLDEDPFVGTDPSCYDGFYLPTGGVFKIDTAGTQLEDAVISSGTLTINNNCEAKYGASSREPANIANGKNSVSVEMEVVCDDISLYRKMVTGKKNGRIAAQKIIYGSYYWEFRHSDNPNWMISFQGNRVPFAAEMPDVDPEGNAGAITFSSEESYVKKVGDSPLIITIINDVPNYTNPADAALPTVRPSIVDEGMFFGKNADEFGEMFINARAAARVLTGTAYHIDGYTGFSKDLANQSGYFTALELDPWEGTQVCKTEKGQDVPWVSLKDDGVVIARIGGDAIDVSAIKVKGTDQKEVSYAVKVKPGVAPVAAAAAAYKAPSPTPVVKLSTPSVSTDKKNK